MRRWLPSSFVGIRHSRTLNCVGSTRGALNKYMDLFSVVYSSGSMTLSPFRQLRAEASAVHLLIIRRWHDFFFNGDALDSR